MENIISTFQIMPSKKLVKSCVFLFLLLTASYLLLLGGILDRIAERKKLNKALERESQALYTLQDFDSKENKNFNLDSFLKLGYAESQKFEVLKTVRNVASIKATRY